MITPTLIYWITRLDALESLAFGMAIFGISIGCLLIVPIIDDYTDDEHKPFLKRIQKLSLFIGVIGVAMSVFIPNKKEMAAIIVLPRIANSETLIDVGDGVKTLALEWIEELRPKKEKSK